MELNIPSKVRGWIYVSIVFFTPTLAYLAETGIIGTAEVTLGTAYIMAAAMLARLNVTPNP